MLVNHLAIVPGRLSKAQRAEVVRDLPRVARALHKQVTRDFEPLWGIKGSVTWYPTEADVPVGCWKVVVDGSLRVPDEGGYHWDPLGQPFGRLAYDVDTSWSATASHEILEMLVDPYGEFLTAAPSVDPKHRGRQVLYLVEVCDPCEDVTYDIDGVTVSDFITPRYFDVKRSVRARYSFTGAVKRPREVLPGGYISWNDPQLGWAFELDRTKGGTAKIKRIARLPGRKKSRARG